MVGPDDMLGPVDIDGTNDTDGAVEIDGAKEGMALGVGDVLGSTHVNVPASSNTYESYFPSYTSDKTIFRVFHSSAMGLPLAVSFVVNPSASIISY